MTVYIKEIKVSSTGGQATFSNISQEVKDIIKQSGVSKGTCTVVSPHTTCAVLYEEYTHDADENNVELLHLDLDDALMKIAPPHNNAATYRYPGPEHYKAVKEWPNYLEYLPGGDPKAIWNGDAHIKASIIGASEILVINNNELAVGKTGYIYFIDFDTTRPRTRTCQVVVMGE